MIITAAELVEQVQVHLRGQGLTPQLSPRYADTALAGAARLLDAMGVQPMPAVATDLAEREPWAETTNPQTCDPYQLVEQVLASAQTLSRGQGPRPEIAPGRYGDALAGAGRLLRALGIQPSMPVEARGALDLDHDLTRDR